MKIRVYLDATIEEFFYRTNTELFTACANFEYCDFNWEVV
jgi:hypothetical protein